MVPPNLFSQGATDLQLSQIGKREDEFIIVLKSIFKEICFCGRLLAWLHICTCTLRSRTSRTDRRLPSSQSYNGNFYIYGKIRKLVSTFGNVLMDNNYIFFTFTQFFTDSKRNDRYKYKQENVFFCNASFLHTGINHCRKQFND